MSHHIRLDFSQTVPLTRIKRPFRLPQIDQNLEKNVDGVIKSAAPKPPSKFRDTSRTNDCRGRSRFTRQRHIQMEFTYRPKKKANGVYACAEDSDIDVFHSTGGNSVIRQAVNTEAVNRKIFVANEAIERQRLIRQVFGNQQEALTENEEHGLRLLDANDYAGAYVYFNRALRQCKQSKITQGRRALCNWHLLQFEGCVEDCRAVLDPSRPMDPEVLSLLCRSLLLLEHYQEAQRWYEHAMEQVGNSTDNPFYVKWRLEYEAIPALRQFCLFAEQRRIREALLVRDAAKVLIDGTPLVVLEARVLLHVDPESARLRLLPYVPTITRPSPTSIGTSMEEKIACRSVGEHYLQAVVLLAQANAYCGSQYLVIAAALVKTCLAINPTFNAAVVLGHYLISLEETVSRVGSLFNNKRYADALPLLSEGLQLDISNRIMCSTLYCLRAEAFSQVGKLLKALDDCDRAVELNPNNAQAFVQRAVILQKTNRSAEAARNRLSAVKLDPSYRHILHGDEDLYEVPQSSMRTSGRSRQSCTDGNQRSRGDWSKSGEFCTSGDTSSVPPLAPPPATILSLYDDLELRKGATVDEVRTQFRKLTLLYHPDRVMTETPEMQRVALERFKLINHAHGVLSDPVKKNLYDLSLGISLPDGLCR